MNTWQIIIAIVVALLGYPVGLLIAKYTSEELRQGRKWFFAIIVACIIAIILSLIFFQDDAPIFLIAVFVFIALLSLASLIKSRGRKFRR